MSPDIVRADLTILIAVGIVTELLSFILIKIEVHDVPFSVGVAKGEERDRLLQQGNNFHTSIVHCLNFATKIILDSIAGTPLISLQGTDSLKFLERRLRSL